MNDYWLDCIDKTGVKRMSYQTVDKCHVVAKARGAEACRIVDHINGKVIFDNGYDDYLSRLEMAL